MTDLLERRSPDSDRPRIDPRIARRWIEARRQEGRRRLQAVLAAVAVLGCLVLAWGSLYTPLFQVRHIRVTVDGSLPAQTVAAWSGVNHRTQTIDVSARAIAARLDVHPALGAARVARHWPGTVTIAVTVRVPVAAVALPGGYAEVDTTGRVLADAATAPAGLPLLQGMSSVPAPGGWLSGSAGAAAAPGAPPARLVDMTAASDGPDIPSGPAAALAFLDALPPLLRSDVTSVSLAPAPGPSRSSTGAGSTGVGDRGMSLVVSPPRMATGTVTVLLGDGSQLQAKADALVAILNEGDLSGVAGLDLTVPSRPAAAPSVAGLSPQARPAAASPPASSGPASGSPSTTANPTAGAKG